MSAFLIEFSFIYINFNAKRGKIIYDTRYDVD